MINVKTFGFLVSTFLGLCFSGQAIAVDTAVTDAKGIKTQVANFKSHYHVNCKGIFYYMSVATEKDFYWDFLPIDTGDYIIRIPFSIITKIKVEEQTDPKNTWRKYYIYSLFLSDDTEVKGIPNRVTEFTGSAELGKFTILTKGVAEIIFKHEPRLNFNATPKGTHSAILVFSDNSQLQLRGASFISETKNKNGCYLREGYPTHMQFATGASEYTISWEKISEIVYIQSEKTSSDSSKAEFKLVTKSESEYVGSANNLIGIEGIIKIGNYNLRIIVPFTSKAKKLKLLN